LIEDEPYAKRLGSYAQARVMSEFHVDRVVEAHLDLYQSAVSGR
jgi:hypothetical protein